jgi:hypothetical protein
MKRQKLIFGAIVLALIGGTALLLAAVPQKLGAPGVKASPVPGSERWRIDLPESVMGSVVSSNRELDGKALEMLPKDTSYAEREYYWTDALPIISSVVMMGTDRTSIHKAEYCLKGQGLNIDQMKQETIRMYEPQPYDLPVIKILASGSFTDGDKTRKFSCVDVYWYVADGALSNDHTGFGRMWSMTKQLVFTGVLQRWAYVRFIATCQPGQEDATYERIKQMIAASVPQFQLTPKPLGAPSQAQR